MISLLPFRIVSLVSHLTWRLWGATGRCDWLITSAPDSRGGRAEASLVLLWIDTFTLFFSYFCEDFALLYEIKCTVYIYYLGFWFPISLPRSLVLRQACNLRRQYNNSMAPGLLDTVELGETSTSSPRICLCDWLMTAIAPPITYSCPLLRGHNSGSDTQEAHNEATVSSPPCADIQHFGCAVCDLQILHTSDGGERENLLTTAW